MKTLMLLRHAKAGFDLSGQADAERVLTHAGKQDALKLGYKLKGRNEPVDHYLCSPATRTRQTLEALREAVGEIGTVEIVPGLYQAQEASVLEIIQSTAAEHQHLMVVGHNPAMTQLANWLAVDLRLDHLPTCGLVCLQFEVMHWSGIAPATGQLTWFDIPKNDHSIL